jgi:hypothetical protein
MPNERGYVWEKMYVAIDCLCGKGEFEERLANATVSALMRLNDDDLDGALGDDLRYVLSWTKGNLDAGHVRRIPDDVEHAKLVEKMLHILIETHET